MVEPTGEVLARVLVPEGLIPLDVRDDTLLGLRRNDLGVERVVLYRIGEEEGGG